MCVSLRSLAEAQGTQRRARTETARTMKTTKRHEGSQLLERGSTATCTQQENGPQPFSALLRHRVTLSSPFIG